MSHSGVVVGGFEEASVDSKGGILCHLFEAQTDGEKGRVMPSVRPTLLQRYQTVGQEVFDGGIGYIAHLALAISDDCPS